MSEVEKDVGADSELVATKKSDKSTGHVASTASTDATSSGAIATWPYLK